MWYKTSYANNIANQKTTNTVTASGVQPKIQSGTTFSIKLRENSFVKVPFPDGTYEIGSNFTNNKINVQLFEHSSRLDGAVIYYPTQTYDQATFAIDPIWRRIIYGRQTGAMSTKTKELDYTVEHPFLYLTAIATKNDGSIFVSDIRNGQISRFVYNYSSNIITKPTNSVFINNSKVKSPTDIELTHDGNYLFVSDLGSESIKRFDMNGNLVSEFTGNGYTLYRPVFVQPRADVDEVYVIDRTSSGDYNLIRFEL